MSGNWDPPAKIEEIFKMAASRFEHLGTSASQNKPTAGAQYPDQLPVGTADFQLYSLATPNGHKVGILLEELGLEYDAHVVNIGTGMQFQQGFVDINPNSKIPAAVDHKPADGGKPVRLFETASIMMYLADKCQRFIPKPDEHRKRADITNWLFWQMAGQGPITGNFGHFYAYAPGAAHEARDYGVNRYGMEVQRLCAVIENHLADGRKYIMGDEYTIADMAILPWFNQLWEGYKNPVTGDFPRTFLGTDKNYPHVTKWAKMLLERPQVQRGLIVCRGRPKPWLTDEKYKHLAKL